MERFLRSHMATVLSAEPVARMYSLNGLKAKQLTSAVWASMMCWALEALLPRVSQLHTETNDSGTGHFGSYFVPCKEVRNALRLCLGF